jgi:hypothetical protein
LAARSFYITFRNLTSLDLSRKDLGLEHGEWGDGGKDVPPEHIPAGGVVRWGSESDGFMTGTEGFASYNSPAGQLTFNWDNPYVGSNGFTVQVPAGYGKTVSDFSGNNADVSVVIYKL